MPCPLPTLLLSLGLLATPARSGPADDGRLAFARGDYPAAAAAFTTGIAAGDPESAWLMARMFELGLGVEKDPAAALLFFRKAADAGHPGALNRLGMAYFRGEAGLGQDYAEAARLFILSARGGDANALFNLGRMHFEGAGMPVDVKAAVDFYRKAAARDHILALNTLGALLQIGALPPEQGEEAKTYFARSAALGNAVGLYESARLVLAEGSAPEQLIEAHVYLNLAAARQHPNASKLLQELTQIMSPSDVMIAQARARSFRAIETAEDRPGSLVPLPAGPAPRHPTPTTSAEEKE